MRAHPGDWLVVETATVDRHSIRGRIEEVSGPAGEPPFRVRWSGDDRVSIVFPGPDARVLTQKELTALDRQRTERFGVRATGSVQP
jgi:hypothetical protein